MEWTAGDCLLYQGASMWSWFIRLKTFAPVSHVEVSVGNGLAVASRDGQGVGLYPYTSDRLFAVLRPTEPVDLDAALAWFATAKGLPYDWWGLMRFFRLGGGKPSRDKMFCSEFATHFYRSGGLHVFDPEYDAELTSPGMFLSSPHLSEIWRRA